MSPIRRLALLGSFLALAAGCGGTNPTAAPPAEDGRLRIATTVSPLTSIVANVVGERAVVSGIVTEGTN